MNLRLGFPELCTSAVNPMYVGVRIQPPALEIALMRNVVKNGGIFHKHQKMTHVA